MVKSNRRSRIMLFLALAILILITAGFVYAKFIPATPDYSISVTNSSYYVPVTYSIDRSTGQSVANNSYYSGNVDALNVTLTIKNQLLAFLLNSDYYHGLKYFVYLKPHSSTDWTYLRGYINGFGDLQTGVGYVPSNDWNTAITLKFSNPYSHPDDKLDFVSNSSGLTYASHPAFIMTIAKNESVDFRIKVGLGTLYTMSMGSSSFSGKYSDWNQQTINLAAGETASSNPSLIDLLILVTLILLIIALILVTKKSRLFKPDKRLAKNTF